MMLLLLVPLVLLPAIPLVYFWLRWRGWFAGTPCTSTRRLDGKVAVVTGGNTGIGKETARDLASRGARVIIGCRDMKKGEQAALDILDTTGQKVELLSLDLADTDSVDEFAREVLARVERLDILVNNAGLMMPLYQPTKQGYEIHMGVNYLGHHLLNHRLYQLLVRTGTEGEPSRVVNVSSEGHKFTLGTGLDVDNPDFGYARWAFKGYFSFHRLYGQSKLAQIYEAKELSRRARDQGHHVLAVSLSPGAVATEVTRYHNLGLPRLYTYMTDNLLYYCGKTPMEGAQTTIHCCVAASGQLEAGGYYDECKLQPLQPWLVDPRKETKLFEVSDKLLGIISW